MSGREGEGKGEPDASLEAALDRLEVVQRLVALARERRRRTPSEGPTRLQRFVLLMAADRKALSVSDIVERLDAGAATASQLIRTMEDRGWLKRSLDPADRRRHLLSLTPDGDRLVAQVRAHQRARMRLLLEQLDSTERANLVALVERVATIAATTPGLLRNDPS